MKNKPDISQEQNRWAIELEELESRAEAHRRTAGRVQSRTRSAAAVVARYKEVADLEEENSPKDRLGDGDRNPSDRRPRRADAQQLAETLGSSIRRNKR